jgi:benzodiazapine receptor
MAVLSWVNAALFALQLGVTALVFYLTGNAATFDPQNQTLVTPAGYAFSIWSLIYVLSMVLLVADITRPELVFYSVSPKPNALRLCFAVSCVANGGWCVLFNYGYVHLATLDMTVLWLALAALYAFASYAHRHLQLSGWREYLCSELCIRVYFAWISAATVLSWAISLQHLHGGILPLEAYLSLLGVVFVLSMGSLLVGRDPVFSVVAVWTLVAIARKDPDSFSGATRDTFVQVQTAAALCGGVLALSVMALGHREPIGATRVR